MKELNEEMTTMELRLAYAKILFDETKTEEEKNKAKEEYDRLMDYRMSLPHNILA